MTRATTKELLDRLYEVPDDQALRNAVHDSFLDDGQPVVAKFVLDGGLPDLAYLIDLGDNWPSPSISALAPYYGYAFHRITDHPHMILLVADVNPEQDQRLADSTLVRNFWWVNYPYPKG